MYTHTCAHTYTGAGTFYNTDGQIFIQTQTYKYTLAHSLTCSKTHTQTHAHAYTDSHARIHTDPHRRIHTRTMHARILSQTRTHPIPLSLSHTNTHTHTFQRMNGHKHTRTDAYTLEALDFLIYSHLLHT